MEPSSPQRQFPPPHQDLPIEKAAPHPSEEAKSLKEKVGEKALNVIADLAHAAGEPSATDAQITVPADTSTTQKITHTAEQTLSHEAEASVEKRAEDLFSKVASSIEDISLFHFADLAVTPMSDDEVTLPMKEVFQQAVGQEEGEEDPFAGTTEEQMEFISIGKMETPTDIGPEELISFFKDVRGAHIMRVEESNHADALQVVAAALAGLSLPAIEHLNNDFKQTGVMFVPSQPNGKEGTYFVNKKGPLPSATQKEIISQHIRQNNVRSCNISLLNPETAKALESMLVLIISDRKKQEVKQKSPEVESRPTTSYQRTIQAPTEARREHKKKIAPPRFPPKSQAAIEREKER